MNFFKRAFLDRLGGGSLQQLVEHWDALEILIMRIHQAREATAADQKEYLRLRAWLNRYYPEYQASLQPYWRNTRIAGEPAVKDPFSSLIAPPHAGEFVANWQAMQMLPAAREALKHYLEQLSKK